MTIGRLAVIALVAVLALGGIGTAVALSGGEDDPAATDPIELRKDDAGADVAEADDDGDDADPAAANTGDGDDTRGDDNTRGGANTGDGDDTRGDDDTGAGDDDAGAGDDDTGAGDDD